MRDLGIVSELLQLHESVGLTAMAAACFALAAIARSAMARSDVEQDRATGAAVPSAETNAPGARA